MRVWCQSKHPRSTRECLCVKYRRREEKKRTGKRKHSVLLLFCVFIRGSSALCSFPQKKKKLRVFSGCRGCATFLRAKPFHILAATSFYQGKKKPRTAVLLWRTASNLMIYIEEKRAFWVFSGFNVSFCLSCFLLSLFIKKGVSVFFFLCKNEHS